MSKTPVANRSHCTKNLGLFGRGKIGLQWLFNQTGLGATNHFEAGGFIRVTRPKRRQIFNFISYPQLCNMTVRPTHNNMAIKHMWDRCCQKAEDTSHCAAPLPWMHQKSPSTICHMNRTGRSLERRFAPPRKIFAQAALINTGAMNCDRAATQ